MLTKQDSTDMTNEDLNVCVWYPYRLSNTISPLKRISRQMFPKQISFFLFFIREVHFCTMREYHPLISNFRLNIANHLAEPLHKYQSFQLH